MRKRDTFGVIVGKFLPFHKGHEYLIEEARKQCDYLFVFVGDRPDDPWPAEERAEWIRETIPGVKVLITPDDIPNEPWPWAARVHQRLPALPIDYAFTSETYGDAWAEAMGAEHICIDLNRETFPISGTEVRNNYIDNLDWLPTATRVALTPRIVVVGAESTGTTTLAKGLAEHYETVWVPEYGRSWWEARRYLEEPWTEKDFYAIVEGQRKMADKMAERANRVLICDTDALVTEVFEDRYLGYVSEYVKFAREHDTPTMYIITGHEIPWQQDGTRESGTQRNCMQEQIRNLVYASGAYFLEVTGTHDERLRDATTLIDYVIERISKEVAASTV